MKELDCRGLACPQPVLKAKEVLDGGETGPFTVVVDNPAARDNVTRFLSSQGCEVETRVSGSDFILTATRTGPASGPEPEVSCQVPEGGQSPRLVVKIANEFMGQGADELGRILMKAFLASLADAAVKPEAVVFYNSGVRLTCSGSENLEAIRGLEESGVRILSCGTCLDYFNLKDQPAVGLVTNMFEIIETLSGADRVVSP